MTPIRQRRIRTLLRSRPDGLTPGEIAEVTGLHVANVRTALRAMPDVYVDRWRLGKQGMEIHTQQIEECTVQEMERAIHLAMTSKAAA